MAVQVYIDGVECTDCVQSGSVTKRLNRPTTATMRMFTDCAPGTAESKAKVYINGDLWIHGFVTQIATEAGEDGNLMSEYSVEDPMMLWRWRVARDGPSAGPLSDPGDFSNPDFFYRVKLGPQIMQEILTQSITGNGNIPEDGEGTLFIDMANSSFPTGTTDLSGAPVDWPMTIAEVFELLASTGTVDAVLTPVDYGGYMATLAMYNGDYGTDRRDEVLLDYATGSHNVRALRMTEDSSNVVNKLWYYLGPRVKTPKDPAGDQHWRSNITGDAGDLPHPPGGDTNPPYTSGAPGSADNPLGQRIVDSRNAVGVRMEVRIYDGQGDESDLQPTDFRPLFLRLWQSEAWIRTVPRTLVYVTPVRESDDMQLPPDVTPVGVGSFDIGDIVTVTAGSVVRGGFTGLQRVYGYTVDWDEDGVLALGEIQTSADQEGL